ncbi:MAG: hypothetical protein V4640_05445 [Verrucomicrobiota bacterium]
MNQLLDAGNVRSALEPENVVVCLILRRLWLDINAELDLVRPQVLQKLGRIIVRDANKVGIKVILRSCPFLDSGHDGGVSLTVCWFSWVG